VRDHMGDAMWLTICGWRRGWWCGWEPL